MLQPVEKLEKVDPGTAGIYKSLHGWGFFLNGRMVRTFFLHGRLHVISFISFLFTDWGIL